MDDFTPLARPSGSQVTIDPTHRQCPSQDFNWPTFHLLNKQARTYLTKPLNLDVSLTHRPFTVANSKGWFAAIRRADGSLKDIILSPLEDLQTALKNAQPSSDHLFVPKRTLTISAGDPIMIAFAHHDTRLLVALSQGSVEMYDTASLFSPGLGSVPPIHRFVGNHGSPKQILPNPGNEPGLNELTAIVWSDHKVQLLNASLESQGGWSMEGPEFAPVAVSWSPKGKHLAIGLLTGDILTFALNNKSMPNKHIPPAGTGNLISINWLSPGHTFRASYGPPGTVTGEIQQIVSLDTKTNTVTVFDLVHPFLMLERKQHAHTIVLPHWDEESLSENAKTLVVVGDEGSVDLEVLGGANGQWYQQSQENPLTLPLSKEGEDTTLLHLDVDLTDTTLSVPIMYILLNDGSVQGWYVTHSKPYLFMANKSAGFMSKALEESDMMQDSAMDRDSTIAPAATVAAPPPFGAFGSSPTAQASPFGTGAPAPGQTSAFGSLSSGSPAFGATAFGQTSAFGQPSAPTFGSTGFGSGSTGAFGNLKSTGGSTNVFGQPSFPIGTSAAAFTPAAAPLTSDMTREASMSDVTAPSFSMLSLGGGSESTESKPQQSVFGSAATSTGFGSSPGFGGDSVIKPATGFGALGNWGSSSNASNSNQTTSTPTAFSSTPTAFSSAPSTTNSGFGQTGLGKPAFGQASFGQSGFGSTGFGSTGFGKPNSSSPSTGGFAAFASSKPAFGSASQQSNSAFPSTSSMSGGGFGAFASGGPGSFATAATQQQKEQTPGGFGAPPLQAQSSSPFTSATGTSSPFSDTKPAAFVGGTAPVFGGTSMISSTPKGSPTKSGLVDMSPPSSPEPMNAVTPSFADREKTPSATTPASVGAFANLKTSPSPFKPAVGFGAFGAPAPTSGPQKTEEKPLSVTAFGATPSASKLPTTTAPAFGAPSQLGTKSGVSAFGATSQLGAVGAVRSAFASVATPTKAPAAGGFSAFSGSTSAFNATATNIKPSFSDLLKTSDTSEEYKKVQQDEGSKKTQPESKVDGTVEERKEVATPTKTVSGSISVFGNLTPTPTTKVQEEASTTPKAPVPAKGQDIKTEESTTPKRTPDGKAAEPYDINASISTDGSFVEVNAESTFDESAEGFISSDFSSGAPTDDEEEEEEEDEEEDEEVEDEKEVTYALPGTRGATFTPPRTSDSPKTPLPPIKEEESTTPPGTPVREARSTSKSPSPTPIIAPAPTLGVGLGRPSTRPMRSSPLAGAPVSNTEEEGEKPSARRGVSPQPRTEPIKKESAEELADTTTKRPKTPPLLGSFGIPAAPVAPKPQVAMTTSTKLPLSFTAQPSTTPPPGKDGTASAPANLFARLGEAKPEIVRPTSTPAQGDTSATTKTPITPFSLPPFSFSPKPTSIPQPVPGIFGGQTAAQPLTPKTTPSPPVVPKTTTPTIPSGIPTGAFAQSKPAVPAPFSLGQQLPIPPAPSPESIIKEEMQAECELLYTNLNQELEELRLLAERVSYRRTELGKPSGGSRQKADLGEPSKWGFGDTNMFGHTLMQFEPDLVEIRKARDAFNQTLRELHSQMLKANTRREEIERFSKAKSDAEFAKMLSSRALGPEHVETQQQLRRNIRGMRDRIQKLESHLQESKKKLAQAASGKPSIKAPTLDVINRTYRNIDVAIHVQADEIAQLTERVAKVEIKPESLFPSNSITNTDDQRLVQRAFAVVPDIATTTTAALRAENSAHKLKLALLKVRKEPILNVQAVFAPLPPSSLKIPQKPPVASSVPFTLTPEVKPEIPLPPDLTLPDDDFRPGTLTPSTRRGASSGIKKLHQSSPQFKKSPGGPSIPGADAVKAQIPAPNPSQPASSFDWGPLPTFNQPGSASTRPATIVPLVPLSATPSSNSSSTPGLSSFLMALENSQKSSS